MRIIPEICYECDIYETEREREGVTNITRKIALLLIMCKLVSFSLREVVKILYKYKKNGRGRELLTNVSTIMYFLFIFATTACNKFCSANDR